MNASVHPKLDAVVSLSYPGTPFLPGFRGNQSTFLNTPLGELMPVVWDPGQPRGWGTALPGKFVLTEAGRSSLLTKLEDSDEASANTWSTLPGFHWYAPALRAKVGTEVLATHGTESTRFGRVPLIVTRPYGSGKILFMGTDGAWPSLYALLVMPVASMESCEV